MDIVKTRVHTITKSRHFDFAIHTQCDDHFDRFLISVLAASQRAHRSRDVGFTANKQARLCNVIADPKLHPKFKYYRTWYINQIPGLFFDLKLEFSTRNKRKLIRKSRIIAVI